ncbi:MAG: DUF1211 domain-containing protein [Proteobacteria bacterium]|nr:DUF1211 domain-containing protein [Pseudomonadota bacterium]
MAANEPRDVRFPRQRVEALTDGIFGVAMTLLVLEIRLPDGANPRTDQDLLAALGAVLPRLLPYALSFVVLGIRWREMVAERPGEAQVGKAYVNWTLANLLMVTFVPFSTLVLGRYGNLAPAVWLYAGNLTGMAICTWRLGLANPQRNAEDTAGFVVFLVAAAVVVGLGFLHTAWAPMGFLFNAFAPPAERWAARRKAGKP